MSKPDPRLAPFTTLELAEALLARQLEHRAAAYSDGQDQTERLRQAMLNLPVHALVTEHQRVCTENGILRGLVARQPLPCQYCGHDLVHCPIGFPGCALADDLLCADDTCFRALVARLHAAEKKLADT